MEKLRWLPAVLFMAALLGGCGSDDSEVLPQGAGGGGSVCEEDADCGASSFCAGTPTCSPQSADADDRGCVLRDAPCQPGQLCDEEKQSCETDCPVTKDADQDGHDAPECGGDDCDDSHANRYPGNTEVCDTSDIDEDCDPTTFGYRDADGDEYADATCCNDDGDGARACGDDCDDQEAKTHPTQLEVCDGLDNDCNGEVDDITGETAAYYLDADGDLYGDSESPLLSCQANLEDYVTNRDDCDDDDPDVNPGERDDDCDGVDDDCSATADDDAISVYFVDADGDGQGDPTKPAPPCAILGQAAAYDARDCDDTNPQRAPYLPELMCDGIDNNCNGVVDTDGSQEPVWYVDSDSDGFGNINLPSVQTCNPGDKTKFTTQTIADCDDTRASVHPGAPELCDGLDNTCAKGGNAVPAEDFDGDKHTSPTYAACSGGPYPKDDCDDSTDHVYPGRAGLCDGIDNDCDGLLDAADDADRDGFAKAGCTPVGGEVDCNDAQAVSYPGAADACDNLDNDCRKGSGTSISEDVDNDGANGLHLDACTGPLDCNDASALSSPTNVEICDGLDNDCNGGTDEDCAESIGIKNPAAGTWYMPGAITQHANKVSRCEAGEVMVGIHTTNGGGPGNVPLNSLAYAAPRCRSIALVLSNYAATGATPTGSTTTKTALNFAPYTSAYVTRDCSTSQIATALTVGANGDYLGGTQLTCGTVVYAQSTFSFTDETQLAVSGPAPSTKLSCPAGKVMTGLRSGFDGVGSNKQGIALDCSDISVVLRAATASWVIDQPQLGSLADATATGAMSTYSGECPAGSYLSGLSVQSSGYLEGVRLRCATLSGTATALSVGASAAGPYVGSAASAGSSADCASGSFLTSVTLGRSSGYFDSAADLSCRKASLPTTPGFVPALAAASTVKLEGGASGTVRTSSCPAGKLASGVKLEVMSSNDQATSFQLSCVDVHVFY